MQRIINLIPGSGGGGVVGDNTNPDQNNKINLVAGSIPTGPK